MISLTLSFAFSLFAAWVVISPLCLKDTDSKKNENESE